LVAASQRRTFPLPLGSRTVPGLSYQLLDSHNCNSQSQSYFMTGGLPPVSSSWMNRLAFVKCTYHTYSIGLHVRGKTTSPRYVAPARTAHKTSLPLFVFCRSRETNVSTELFPSNDCCTVACLHSCYLALGLHVTVLYKLKTKLRSL
jgi:hypothetical protein